MPRVINIVADAALVCGFADHGPLIDKDCVCRIVKDEAKHGSLQLGQLIRRAAGVFDGSHPGAPC